MQWMLWVGFLLLVVSVVALDLGVFHREAKALSTREALAWTGVWVTLALCFNVAVYFIYEYDWYTWGDQNISGATAATQFLTGYVLEESLSVDNIFVIALIFRYFRVPLSQQHRVLFWGILGAVVLRGIMIGLGAALIHRFEWITHVFGALLIFSAVKMMVSQEGDITPEESIFMRLTRRLVRVTDQFHGSKFFIREGGNLVATPLFLCLVLVESSDVMFAVDSIPAVFGVTQDPFLVVTSNVFAILGLRSLYFVLANFLDSLRYLKMCLVFILAFVGVKMLIKGFEVNGVDLHIPDAVSLSVIAGTLTVGILASLIANHRDAVKAAEKEKSDDNEHQPRPPMEIE